MSLLPCVENYNHAIKVDSESSLEYQLEKVMYFSSKVDSIVVKGRDTYYIGEPEYQYNLDSLINNFSTLIEYFYSYVAYSIIGTIKLDLVKITYEYPSDKKTKDKIRKNLFNTLKIGVLEKAKDHDFEKKCSSFFDEYSKIFFSSKYHEIYVLNNYIKHNKMLLGYAPLVNLNSKPFSFAYIRIENHNNNLINNSILKNLSKHPYDEIHHLTSSESNNDDKFYFFGFIGGIKLLNINGIDYIKGSDSAGITIESIMDVTKKLCLDILDVIEKNKQGHITLLNKIGKMRDMLINSRDYNVFNKMKN